MLNIWFRKLTLDARELLVYTLLLHVFRKRFKVLCIPMCFPLTTKADRPLSLKALMEHLRTANDHTAAALHHH